MTTRQVTWSCELRFYGERYGGEAQILRDGELFAAHGEAAVKWGEEQRKDAERGFLEDY